MEAISNYIQSKIQFAKNLFSKSTDFGIDMQSFIQKISDIEIKFAIETSHLFILGLFGNEFDKRKANFNFNRIITMGNFFNTIDIIFEQGVNFLSSRGINIRSNYSTKSTFVSTTTIPPNKIVELQRIIDMYPHGENIDNISLVDEQYDKCSVCGGEMFVDTQRSELICNDLLCGSIKPLVGTVFEESQFYNQEGQKSKSGTFNPNRHFQFWWMHILAREPEEEIGDKNDPNNHFGEKLLAIIRSIIARDNKLLRLLTVDDNREILCELGRTDLNKNVPLILKKLTGIGPPQVPDFIAVKVENLFTKAIEIGEKIKKVDRTNRNYYPYYIYKILDDILEEKSIFRRVLYYIYMQSRETVEADDDDWEQICQELIEITYKPTDRTMALKYHVVI